MAYGVINVEQMTTQSGYTLGAGNASSFKNRIINGAMVIDQRNAGASTTPTADAYNLDRWILYITQVSKFAVQQSSTAPAGFTKSTLFTSQSAYSVVSSDYFYQVQRIEGNNVADLAWGTASAATVTLSFWVRSSLTGTFGGVVKNSAQNRSYPFSYTVSAANTWEQKSITIAGDTSGTWLTDTGTGIFLGFSLGAGSTFLGTAGAWSGNNYVSCTGATNVVGTSGATFYITGVQLEVGTVATSFDYRSYGTELALCQRYCMVYSGNSAYNGSGYARYPAFGGGANSMIWYPTFPTQMRTTPTLITSNFTSGNVQLYNYDTAVSPTFSSVVVAEGSPYAQQVVITATSGILSGAVASWRWNNQPDAYIGFSAEL